MPEITPGQPNHFDHDPLFHAFTAKIAPDGQQMQVKEVTDKSKLELISAKDNALCATDKQEIWDLQKRQEAEVSKGVNAIRAAGTLLVTGVAGTYGVSSYFGGTPHAIFLTFAILGVFGTLIFAAIAFWSPSLKKAARSFKAKIFKVRGRMMKRETYLPYELRCETEALVGTFEGLKKLFKGHEADLLTIDLKELPDDTFDPKIWQIQLQAIAISIGLGVATTVCFILQAVLH